MTSGVRVQIGDRPEVEVAVGHPLVFGRLPGPGQLALDDTRVSRRHGEIAATAAGTWTVTATGSHAGVAVYDHETPSRLHVPCGVGPVLVPFARASVVIEIEEQRHAFTVSAPGLAGWSGSWESVLRATEAPVDPSVTQIGWDGVRGRDERTGRPLRWFQTLVAMCEPYFADPPEERVPTDDELARRLGTTKNMVQSRLIGSVRDALGFDTYTPQLRQTMVSIAISQGLVTAADLAVLDIAGDADAEATDSKA